MKSKILIFSLFIVVVITQLYVPLKMILNEENVLKTGIEFKFKTEPFDPSDPFRGKYIRLNFQEDKFEIQNKEDWIRDEEIYVVLKNNNDGYAEIQTVLKEKPTKEIDFITANVKYIYSYKDTKNITIKYPFERFYMKETKAKNAELLTNEILKDTTKTVYASIFIKNGKAVLNNVLIDGVPIKDLVKEEYSN